MLPTFADAGAHDLGFLRLLGRVLRGTCRRAPLSGRGTRVRRYVGDAAFAGKGEILVLSG